MILHYDPKLKNLAKKLRKNMTLPEVLLWNQLKGKKLGFDFHRQKPIDRYIVDFYCPELKLVIEVDGSVHLDKGENDIIRQLRLESLGLNVLRFKATDILKNLNDVIDSIQNYISKQ
ncbi:MAG: endonuclease domain-containing protein [Candidatus Cloacimonetes bacterium]|nr:endonuclease domain-containing protein [Candidatus Cloacimonadota bacterium]